MISRKAQEKDADSSAAGLVAYDVASFCRAHCISRAHLYKLLKDGRGPKIMKVGRRTLISAEAARAWREAMEVGLNTSSPEENC